LKCTNMGGLFLRDTIAVATRSCRRQSCFGLQEGCRGFT
jgi:hypothetical protein